MTVTSVLLTIFTAICQAFFMGLFFFLLSYFIPASYNRKGAVRFLKDRLLRLGIPLVLYCLLIGPVTVWYAQLRGEMTLSEFYRTEVWSFKQIFFGPAWFLEASLYFTILYAGYRLLTGTSAVVPSDRPFPTHKAILAAAVGTGLIAFAVRFIFPAGEGPLGLQLGYFPSYILLFIAGIYTYHNNWLHQISAPKVKLWGWISVCAIPILPVGLILTGALDGNLTFDGGLNFQALLYALWEPFVCFGIILMLLRLFQNIFHTAGKFSKWMSAHAYTVYLIHPAVIVFWTISFHHIMWPPAIKWVIVSAISVFFCFLISAILRFIPGAKRIL